MKQVYCMIIALMGMASMQAYKRGYQRTIDRAQVDRSRAMMYSKPRYEPVIGSMTGRPEGGQSWRARTQEMEAQNLAAEMPEM